MKRAPVIFFSAFCLNVSAQPKQPASKILSKAETTSVFADSISKRLQLKYPIRRAYTYTDKTGSYYLALSEKFYRMGENSDSLYQNIKAVNVKRVNNSLSTTWEITDAIKVDDNKGINETSIWFWTKYCDLSDTDADGVADPIIIYGTIGANGVDDGRINFLIYYKGQKTAIRHQSGISDYDRSMRIDKAFYALPLSLQKKVRAIMLRLTAENNIIFPAGYEKGMTKKALVIDENKNSCKRNTPALQGFFVFK